MISPPSSPLKLRDYQVAAVNALRVGFQRGHRRQILCAPTGAGKTVMAAHVIKNVVAKGRRVAFIADRIALIHQTSLRLHEAGIDHGVIQADNSYGAQEPVQVVSAQTLEARNHRIDPDLIIVDEAHTKRKHTTQLLNTINTHTIGLTATPFTDGLGDIYSNIVNAEMTAKLIEEKWLVRPRVFSASPIDMSNSPKVMGEWTNAECARKAQPILGDIVTEWVDRTNQIYGGPVKTLVFAPTIQYGSDLLEEFTRLGYRFKQVPTHNKNADKTAISEFREGKIIGLISCDALAKGFDVPDALCLISARPYSKSFTAHIQQIGRIMRASPGKDFGLVLDHAQNYSRWFGDTEDFWVNGCHHLDSTADKKEREKKERSTEAMTCPRCDFVMEQRAKSCANCGHVFPPKVDKTITMPGHMKELVPHKLETELGDLWPHISAIAILRHPDDPNKAYKYALAQYRNLTQRWPGYNRPLEPIDYPDSRVQDEVEKSIRRWIRGKKAESKQAIDTPNELTDLWAA